MTCCSRTINANQMQSADGLLDDEAQARVLLEWGLLVDACQPRRKPWGPHAAHTLKLLALRCHKHSRNSRPSLSWLRDTEQQIQSLILRQVIQSGFR